MENERRLRSKGPVKHSPKKPLNLPTSLPSSANSPKTLPQNKPIPSLMDKKILPPPQTHATTLKSTKHTQQRSRTPSPSNSETSASFSSTTSEKSSSTTTSKKLSFRYSIQNIPAPLATQKSFYSHLISLGLHQIDSLKVNYNKSALLVLSRQLTPNQISTLQAGFPGSKIQFKLLNPTRLLPQIEPKPITFSIVVILLKHLPDTAITSITTIYNSCFNSGHFPTPWKEATTIMIPKPNKDPNNPLSYRPISLLNILGKIFETILASRLRHTLEENNLLPPEQFGFRPHRSTSDPTFELFTDSTRSANLGQCTLAVFLDVERAFDRVWHDGLIQKFLSHNINLNFIKLIDSFLSNRSCKVKVQNSFSYPVPLLSGVPQGSVLSPILYIFYSSDFPVSDLHQTKTRFFADDTALWTSRTTAASASRTLQPLLNQISTWTRKWRVKINPTKSTAILFKHPNLTRNKKFDPRDITITLDNTPIDLVPSTRTRSRKSATDPTSSAISWETSKGAIPALFSTPTTHSSDPSSSTEPPSTHLSHTPRHIALPHANDKSFAEFTASTASTPAIPSTRTQTPPPSQTVFTNSNKTTSNAHSTTTTQLPKTHSTLHISFSHATTLFATESPGSPEENCPIHPRRFSQRCTPTCPTIFNFSLKRRPSQ
nr:PREDICTED: LINE-1 retrotransposable element ORF2 protein [Tribolium castaneum]|eukprot:XP_008201458.1 PREDICTED: LINE-1 retrotransposable element ORF2 protein [Tribolium castaneum]